MPQSHSECLQHIQNAIITFICDVMRLCFSKPTSHLHVSFYVKETAFILSDSAYLVPLRLQHQSHKGSAAASISQRQLGK